MLFAGVIFVVSCGRTVPSSVPPGTLTSEGYQLRVADHLMTFDSDAKISVSPKAVIIRGHQRETVLDRSKVGDIVEVHDSIAKVIALKSLPRDDSFDRRSAACGLITPQSGVRHVSYAQGGSDCTLPPDDMFSKMQQATGPGDIIPGINRGGGGRCPDLTVIGTPWLNVHYDITTGDGDPNAYCTTLDALAGGGGRPFLHGLATDYRYSISSETVALDTGIPGDTSTTRSFLMTYRGPGILIDGSVGVVGSGLSSATYFYGPGIDGTGSTMRVNFYQGAVAVVGRYLGFGGAAAPRVTP